MPLSLQKRKIYGAVLLVFLLMLAACGSKKQGAAELEIVPPDKIDKNGTDLTGRELAALKSTGQIDRHVPENAMADVAAQYKYFLRKGRGTMCAFSKRSEQYLAYARKVFKERGMPEELANLAIVESGYNPKAVSNAGAAGAWQFMPETGEHYGLKQDWWQDERLDPYRATEAAADYLQKLYNDFGDWPTAIAAYNAGEGKMSRAKLGTGGKNFFEVNALNHTLDEKTQLRDETRQYVPRFMAVTKIMRNLPQLGFEPIAPENSETVLRLKARPGTDLREFSRACNLKWDEFAKYNQHHKRHITSTDETTFVYVPSRVQSLASAYLCTDKQPSYAGWRPVAVAKNGDTLEKISKRSNIPLGKLQAANPGLDKLQAGQIILAPVGARMAVPKQAQVASAARSKTSAASGVSHKFKANDTLFAIAKKYNTTVAALKSHNGIADPAKIKAGAVLSIPSKPVQGKSSGRIGSRKATTYVVKEKDNLWSIARRHKISVDDLRRLNKINEKSLKPGAKLIVRN